MRVIRAVDGPSLQKWRVFPICVFLASCLFVSLPALAQNSSQTITGTVASFSKNTLVVKGQGGQYRLFVFDRNTVKSDPLASGPAVRVVSTQTEDPEVRLAVLVEAAAPGAPAAPPQPDNVPPSIRSAERLEYLVGCSVSNGVLTELKTRVSASLAPVLWLLVR